MRLFLFIVFIFCSQILFSSEKVFYHETFNDLRKWRHIGFPEDEFQTRYKIEQVSENRVLKTESNRSASGMLSQKYFNPYLYPFLSWDWKVENIYKKGNILKKDTSDLPLAIYVVFQYDPEKASVWEKIKYNTLKLFYGEYPPYKALCYAWANRPNLKGSFESVYSDRIAMILLQKGKKNLKKWLMEEVNFLDDYRVFFRENPPSVASIGVMNDSDDTKEKAISYVDNIKVFNKPH